MNRHNIIKKLQCKFDEMVKLLPSQFKEEFREKAYIAGGCIYSLANDKPVHDYDFFLTDEEFANKLLEYFKSIVTKNGFKDGKVGVYQGDKLLITKYAISFGEEFQVVVKYIGLPEDVCDEFDFKHNKFAFKDGELLAFDDWNYLETDKLYFNDGRVRDISGTIQRIPKMIEKGFVVTKVEISKMLKRLSETGFDEREMEIIEDRLTY